VPVFNELVEVRRPWADWLFLQQTRNQGGGGGFVIHNPWGNTDQPQGAASRNRLEIGYRQAGGGTLWGQFVIHGPTGNVGIGNVDPKARLHVNGNVIVTGDIALPAGDLAEEFTALDEVDPGTVMVLDADGGGVAPCTEAYDRKVAGVVAGAGDYRPAIVLDRQEAHEGRIPIAMVGKAFARADARIGPIAVGDLLTTSETPGHAMRADDASRAFGAILGKALQPLHEGTGLVPVLVTLQ
jgi:hypothetical protein